MSGVAVGEDHRVNLLWRNAQRMQIGKQMAGGWRKPTGPRINED
jgi:hypothetical protein